VPGRNPDWLRPPKHAFVLAHNACRLSTRWCCQHPPRVPHQRRSVAPRDKQRALSANNPPMMIPIHHARMISYFVRNNGACGPHAHAGRPRGPPSMRSPAYPFHSYLLVASSFPSPCFTEHPSVMNAWQVHFSTTQRGRCSVKLQPPLRALE
jgi:hypothetical protein